MKAFFARIIRLLVTLVVVAVAGFFGYQLWNEYMHTPWTRDGHVRADVIGVTPDVSGLVSKVLVSDNQSVQKGDVLLQIDQERFALALRLANAAVDEGQAALTQAQRDAERLRSLSRNVASEQSVEQAELAAAKANAALQQAITNRDVAQLNLQRSVIRAPANGVISNLSLNAGDYVAAGKAVLALIDTDTMRVEGYFDENQLPQIRVGDPVKIELMGRNETLRGEVESIAGGIVDRERAEGSDLLANVTPTFSWVRLAQRVPVRIELARIPDDLVVGLTATVTVMPDRERTLADAGERPGNAGAAGDTPPPGTADPRTATPAARPDPAAAPSRR